MTTALTLRSAPWRLALACVPLLLAACTGALLPKPPAAPARYTLDDAGARRTVASAPVPVPVPGAPALVVAPPTAAAGHDSTRMVYLRHPLQLEAFAFNEWVDTPARMLAPRLVRALQDSGAFGAVLLAPSTGQGGLRLETQLIRLQQDFGQRPSTVRLTLRAVLLETATRRVIGWQEFDETVAAATDDPAGGAAAADLATGRVLAAVADFCAARVRR